MPPTLVHSLVAGVTWALHCEACRREIAVDDQAGRGCRRCPRLQQPGDVRAGEVPGVWRPMKQTGGYQVSMLKRTGHMPRLVVSDGSDWRKLSQVIAEP